VASRSDQPLGHNRQGLKRGRGCAPLWEELRPHLTRRRLGRGLPPYGTKWHLDPYSRLATTGRRVGAVLLFSGEGVRSCLHLTHNMAKAEACLHAKWHLDPSSGTVSPQYTNFTDRTGRTYMYRQRSDRTATRFTNSRPKMVVESTQ